MAGTPSLRRCRARQSRHRGKPIERAGVARGSGGAVGGSAIPLQESTERAGGESVGGGNERSHRRRRVRERVPRGNHVVVDHHRCYGQVMEMIGFNRWQNVSKSNWGPPFYYIAII